MRVLLVGDSPVLYSGTARVLRSLGDGLAEAGDEVGYLSSYHTGEPGYRHPIWPWVRANENPDVSAQLFLRAVESFKPDRIVCFGDAWYYTGLFKLKRSLSPSVGLMLYLTIDCAPVPVGCYATRIFDAADWLATTTQYGADLLSGRIGGDLGTEHRLHYPTHAVPLGVDTAVFNADAHPNRDEIRQIHQDERLFIGWVGMNQCRKHPGAALEVLAHLLRGGVKAMLWMKTFKDGDYNLLELCAHLKLNYSIDSASPLADVVITEKAVDDTSMAEYYRRCDVFLSTGSAGAPDLPLLEARACGTPAIAVHTSSFPEVANVTCAPRGALWAIPNVRHELPDPMALAGAVMHCAENEISAGEVRDIAVTVDEIRGILCEQVPDRLSGIVA